MNENQSSDVSLDYLEAKVKYALENPRSLETYPQTLDNWLRVLLSEIQLLKYTE